MAGKSSLTSLVTKPWGKRHQIRLGVFSSALMTDHIWAMVKKVEFFFSFFEVSCLLIHSQLRVPLRVMHNEALRVSGHQLLLSQGSRNVLVGGKKNHLLMVISNSQRV